MTQDILLAKDTSTGYFDFVIEDGDAKLIDSTEASVIAQVGSDRRADASADMPMGERRGFVHEDIFPSLVYGSLAWTVLAQGRDNDVPAVTGFTREAVSQVEDLEDLTVQTGFIDGEITIYVGGKKVL